MLWRAARRPVSFGSRFAQLGEFISSVPRPQIDHFAQFARDSTTVSSTRETRSGRREVAPSYPHASIISSDLFVVKQTTVSRRSISIKIPRIRPTKSTLVFSPMVANAACSTEERLRTTMHPTPRKLSLSGQLLRRMAHEARAVPASCQRTRRGEEPLAFPELVAHTNISCRSTVRSRKIQWQPPRQIPSRVDEVFIAKKRAMD